MEVSRSRPKRYFGMTGSQVVIIGMMALLLCAVLSVGLILVLSDSGAASPQVQKIQPTYTPLPTYTPFPTHTPQSDWPPTWTPAPVNSECDNVKLWMAKSTIRLSAAQDLISTSIAQLKSASTADQIRILKAEASSFASFTDQQKLSNPPQMAYDANDNFTKFYFVAASAYTMVADGLQKGSKSEMDTGFTLLDGADDALTTARSDIDVIKTKCQ